MKAQIVILFYSDENPEVYVTQCRKARWEKNTSLSYNMFVVFNTFLYLWYVLLLSLDHYTYLKVRAERIAFFPGDHELDSYAAE